MTGSNLPLLGQAFGRALEQILPHLSREQGFIADFLHISSIDTSITFADYMMLETFFRRGASSYLASQQGKFLSIRGAMEGVFGWLEVELRDWVDGVLQRDPMCVLSFPLSSRRAMTDLAPRLNRQVVGILAVLNRFIEQGERQHNEFVARALQKQYQKSLSTLERSCVSASSLSVGGTDSTDPVSVCRRSKFAASNRLS